MQGQLHSLLYILQVKVECFNNQGISPGLDRSSFSSILLLRWIFLTLSPPQKLHPKPQKPGCQEFHHSQCISLRHFCLDEPAFCQEIRTSFIAKPSKEKKKIPSSPKSCGVLENQTCKVWVHGFPCHTGCPGALSSAPWLLSTSCSTGWWLRPVTALPGTKVWMQGKETNSVKFPKQECNYTKRHRASTVPNPRNMAKGI